MNKAVITGDIIQSTKLRVEGRTLLTNSLKDALKLWDKDFNMKSELYRGDSFQCLVQNPANALRICLIIKTYIRRLNTIHPYEIRRKNGMNKNQNIANPRWIFDARISIGIGKVYEQNRSIATSDGEAFQLSGRLLDQMKAQKQTLAISSSDSYNNELMTELTLLDSLILKTTALQCEVINLKLLGYTETQIAKDLKVGQSAVNQRSNSGSWNAIETLLNRFEYLYGI
ncbi:MAG: hypothetical protein V4613_00705 [Bacteroidota bacterium]